MEEQLLNGSSNRFVSAAFTCSTRCHLSHTHTRLVAAFQVNTA